jgi:hypothetical protein
MQLDRLRAEAGGGRLTTSAAKSTASATAAGGAGSPPGAAQASSQGRVGRVRLYVPEPPMQVVPGGEVVAMVQTGPPEEHEIRPVEQALPVSHAAPSVQGTQAEVPVQTMPTPQVEPGGAGPPSTQVSICRPPAEFWQRMIPRRQAEPTKHWAPSTQGRSMS